MAKYAIIRNGMTNAEEEDLLFFENEYTYQEGVIDVNALEVVQRGAGANMSVDVAAGRAVIKNDSWSLNSASETKFWTVLSTATTNVTITSNSSGNPRIDIIVCELDDGTSPDADAANIVSIYAVAGTPAASPSAPSTPTNAILLAEVAVASGAVSIVTANITDSRQYANLYLPEGNGMYAELGAADSTLFYGGTNVSGTPDGDGFRFRYDASYAGASGTGDFLIWEKTDGNQASPDGGFIYLLTGNDGVVEESLEIGGDGNLYLHDGNAMYFENSGDTANTYIQQGTNFSIVASASAGYFDVDFSAGSGEFRLKSGTDLLLYSAANTVSTGFYQGTNLEITPSSGNIHIFSASYDVHLRVYDSGGGSNYLDIYQTSTDSVMNANGGDFTLSATDNIVLAPTDTGNVLVFHSSHDAHLQVFDNGGGSNYLDMYTTGTTSVVHANGGALNITAGGTQVNFSVGAAGGFDFDQSANNEYIKLPTINGDPSSIADGQIWYSTATNTFRVRENGVTRTM